MNQKLHSHSTFDFIIRINGEYYPVADFVVMPEGHKDSGIVQPGTVVLFPSKEESRDFHGEGE
jgi:hypothetical protein